MVVNILVTIADLTANLLSFGATSPFDPSGSTGVQKLRVGGIASPPGATFSIWGIIFGWQFVYLVAQFGCCCDVKSADVMKVNKSMIISQLAQMAYGLVVYLVPDKGTCLTLASIVITAALLAFLYLQSQLKDYQLGTFFWLTFGYGINCAWLVVATYVQWSSFFVYYGLPMNILQIPFLILTVILYCFFSFYPAFLNPPVFFCVSFWTFTFQAILWAPQPGADKNFTEGVQLAYRIIVAVAAGLSLPGAIYVFCQKAKQPDAEWSSDVNSASDE